MIGKTNHMKLILLTFTLIFTASFTFLSPKKKDNYESPQLDKTMVYIPSVSFDYREADALKIGEEFVETSVIGLKAYYISPYETSNGQYLEFIREKKKNSDSTWKTLLPDTTVWRHKHAMNEPYVDYYFRHPAYQDYPVVGITHAQAEKYCEWLTQKYNSQEKRKFKKVIVRLPTKTEWYAATQIDLRDKKTQKKVNVKMVNGYKIFPWNGPWIQNGVGDMLANFVRMNNSTVYRDYDTIIDASGNQKIKYEYKSGTFLEQGLDWSQFAGGDVTTPVKSYWPNEAGLYCLGGNVEEFVAEYGITKGGSWRDSGYYLRNEVYEKYDSTNETSAERGFRFVMEVVEE
jgi:sulfatase modifying factor 1